MKFAIAVGTDAMDRAIVFHEQHFARYLHSLALLFIKQVVLLQLQLGLHDSDAPLPAAITRTASFATHAKTLQLFKASFEHDRT